MNFDRKLILGEIAVIQIFKVFLNSAAIEDLPKPHLSEYRIASFLKKDPLYF